MLLSSFMMYTPTRADRIHIGTIRMIAIGSDQLSYWAASTISTKTTASGNTSLVNRSLLARICWSVSSVHSELMVDGSWSAARSSMIWIAWDELVPGAVDPLIS